MAPGHVELVSLPSLRPWARNARTHSKKQVRQIADSIRQFGFTNPVLIDGSDTILAGHGRVAAAKLLGMEEVPCLRLDRMSAEEKRAYVLADNKLAQNAGWDEEILAQKLNELAGLNLDFDVGLTGFSDDGPLTKAEVPIWRELATYIPEFEDERREIEAKLADPACRGRRRLEAELDKTNTATAFIEDGARHVVDLDEIRKAAQQRRSAVGKKSQTHRNRRTTRVVKTGK